MVVLTEPSAFSGRGGRQRGGEKLPKSISARTGGAVSMAWCVGRACCCTAPAAPLGPGAGFTSASGRGMSIVFDMSGVGRSQGVPWLLYQRENCVRSSESVNSQCVGLRKEECEDGVVPSTHCNRVAGSFPLYANPDPG